MSEREPTTANREVYPSCDIETGKYLKKGDVLEISIEAIQQILTDFGAEESVQLHFNVDSRLLSKSRPETDQLAGGECEAKPWPYSNKHIKCNVAFGIEEYTARPEVQTRLNPRVRGATFQTLAVHELKHVADISNRDTLRRETVYRSLKLGEYALIRGGVVLVPLAALTAAAGLLPSPSSVPEVASSFGAFAMIAWWGAPKVWNLSATLAKWRLFSVNFNSPFEKRAYAAQQHAHRMPNVISINREESSQSVYSISRETLEREVAGSTVA